MKSFFGLVAGLMLSITSAWAVSSDEVVGLYTNKSESSFVYTLKLDKDGKATWKTIDAEAGKTIVMAGRWKLDGMALAVDFAKKGMYAYQVQEKLSYDAFGCKGGSFGLAIKSMPTGPSSSPDYHVWRVKDFKKPARCG